MSRAFPTIVDEISDELAEAIEQIKRAKSYDEMLKITNSRTFAFDEVVKMEDYQFYTFLRLLRASDDQGFVSLVRRIKDERPKWSQRSSLNMAEVIREEIDMRFLLARLERPIK